MFGGSGSSAPEILLSSVELLTNGFEAGALGPQTVVGSAAFNLYVITSVCISALPLTFLSRWILQVFEKPFKCLQWFKKAVRFTFQDL